MNAKEAMINDIITMLQGSDMRVIRFVLAFLREEAEPRNR